MSEATRVVVEDIALEGLDGITLEDLWYRLLKRNGFPLALDAKSKDYIWKKILVKQKEFEFYLLKAPREPLQDEEKDYSDVGIEIWKPMKLLTSCPPQVVDEDGVLGSCSSYKTRKKITEKIRDPELNPLLSYGAVKEEYGNRLVIVASQWMREKFLFLDSVDPIFCRSKITKDMYLFLEMIGRMRYEGLTGPNAFAHISTASPKSTHGVMGYFRLKLIKFGLIYKQPAFFMKEKGGFLRFCSENICHLRRFFVHQVTPYSMMHAKVEAFLLEKPKRKFVMAEVCHELGIERRRLQKYASLRKQFFTMSHFTGVRDTNGEFIPIDFDKQRKALQLAQSSGSLVDIDTTQDSTTMDVDISTPNTPHSDHSLTTSQSDTPNKQDSAQQTKASQSNTPNIHNSARKCISDESFTINVTDSIHRNETNQSSTVNLPDSIHMEQSNQSNGTSTSNADNQKVNSSQVIAMQAGKEPVLVKSERVKGGSVSGPPQLSGTCVKGTNAWDEPDRNLSFDKKRDSRAKKGYDNMGRKIIRNTIIITLKMTIQEFEEQEATQDEGDNSGSESDDQIDTYPLQSRHNIHDPLIIELKQFIKACGKDGVTKAMIRQAFGLHTLQARQIVKTLKKDPQITPFYIDDGRQRIERLAHTNEYTPIKIHPGPNSELNSAEPTKVKTAKSTLSERAIKRNNRVIELTNEHTLLLVSDLYKIISTEEEDLYDSKMDRKTLKRIVERLDEQRKITAYKTFVQVEKKKRDLHYVCKAGTKLTDQIMVSSLEHQRSELAASMAQAQRPRPKVPTTVKKEKKEENTLPYEYDKDVASKRYGFAAKMKRIDLLHKFLCYIVYNYEGTPVENPPNVAALVTETTEDFDEMFEKIPVYHDSQTWKRFVAPDILKSHYSESGRGELLLIDLGTQLPLQLFLGIIKIPYFVPELLEYLKHPVKRSTPVKYLPTKLQTVLLYRKKWITSLRETITRMIMMGLCTNISYTAPTGAAFREMSCIYLHKMAVVKDTRCDDDESVYHKYQLDKSMYEVEHFWLDLRDICTSSCYLPAVQRAKPRTQEEKLNAFEERLHDFLKLPQVKEASMSKTRDQIKEGVIPGDGLGVAGLDTRFFAHLLRHWTSCFEKMVPNPRPNPNRKTRLGDASTAEQRKAKRQHLMDGYTTITPQLMTISEHKTNNKKRFLIPGTDIPRKRRRFEDENLTDAEIKKKRDDKKKLDRRKEPDEMDKKALLIQAKQRSCFSEHEIILLLLCKIGLRVLGCKDMCKKQVRDVLYKYIPCSHDKTSSACWARINRMMKGGKREKTVNLHYNLALSDPTIAALQDSAQKVTSADFEEKYFKIMDLIVNKFGYQSLHSYIHELIDLNDVNSLTELTQHYDIIQMEEEMIVNLQAHAPRACDYTPVIVNWTEPETEQQIYQFTLYNFILGYLLGADKANTAYQVHKVFEQYNNPLIDSVIKLLWQNKVINLKRSRNSRYMKKYQLTYRYRLFVDKLLNVNIDTYLNSGQLFNTIYQTPDQFTKLADENARSNLILFITLLPVGGVDISFILPERVVDITDVEPAPDDDDDDESSEKISDRFEHCSIKPCQIQVKLSPDLPDIFKHKPVDDKRILRRLTQTLPDDVSVDESLTYVSKHTDYNTKQLKKYYNRIQEAGIRGVSVLKLKEEGYDDQALLSALESESAILTVGATELCYVTYENSRCWVVRGLKNTKGRGGTSNTSLQSAGSSTSTQSDKDSSEQQAALFKEKEFRPTSTYTEYTVIPRAWLNPDGHLNYDVVYTLLSSLLSTISQTQGITLDRLQKNFSMCYTETSLIPLIEILEELGCVRKLYHQKSSQKPKLFSKRYQSYICDSPNSDTSTHYIATHESTLRLGQFINNTCLKRPNPYGVI